MVDYRAPPAPASRFSRWGHATGLAMVHAPLAAAAGFLGFVVIAAMRLGEHAAYFFAGVMFCAAWTEMRYEMRRKPVGDDENWMRDMGPVGYDPDHGSFCGPAPLVDSPPAQPPAVHS